MTRESSEKVERPRHKIDSGNDVLQSYRLGQSELHQPNRLLGEGFNLPVKGNLEIPNIWKSKVSDSSADKPRAGRAHEVDGEDTLWSIAKKTLKAAGDPSSNTDISRRVQSIIRANSEEHPRLVRNPHKLSPGMNLHIPDHDGPAVAVNHRRRERAERPETAERSERDKPKERKVARDHQAGDQNDPHANDGDGGRLARAMKQFGHDLADAATRIAQKLGTIGDCAKGPRLTLNELGFRLPPAIATEQGRMIKESGLFHEVPRDQVRPGDYGVRDWSHKVTKRHGGVNKGDSFIVTAVSADGSLRGANDHTFNVPEDGGRYRNLKFMRPTPEFFRRYGANI